ncbi:unknown [Firmicutes bacterium CAG:822]|mgnify:FL=1|nr:unknown [Firmicutes bacterium CAG:822]
MYILAKDSFSKKGQSVRYKIVINSRFNDDIMLQQAFAQKLNELGYQKDYNYSGNTYHKRYFINEYFSYKIQNGKIYLDAFIKQFNKELPPYYGLIWYYL